MHSTSVCLSKHGLHPQDGSPTKVRADLRRERSMQQEVVWAWRCTHRSILHSTYTLLNMYAPSLEPRRTGACRTLWAGTCRCCCLLMRSWPASIALTTTRTTASMPWQVRASKPQLHLSCLPGFLWEGKGQQKPLPTQKPHVMVSTNILQIMEFACPQAALFLS